MNQQFIQSLSIDWNKIEDDNRNTRYILTVWGIGYKLGDTL